MPHLSERRTGLPNSVVAVNLQKRMQMLKQLDATFNHTQKANKPHFHGLSF